jgi:UDP-3-O-[3-hydroxymyristoyl] glucosamine N-acyltransferase
VRLREIARVLGLDFEGDGSIDITGLAGLDDAGPSDLGFVTGPRYKKSYSGSQAAACLLPAGFDSLGRPCLRSVAPYFDFARAIELLLPRPRAALPGVHATAVVADDAELGPGVSVGPYSVVGAGCRIGERSVIHPHVTLYPAVEIGSDCVLHSGAQLREGTRLGDRVVVGNGTVIGADGFGYTHAPDGRRVLIPHRSPVEIGDDVEIGALSAIDASHPGQGRAGFAQTRTRIGSGTKIDNLVQVGHGCVLGENVIICAQAGLAGSTVIGVGVTIGGQSAFAGHLKVGDFSLIGSRAGVHGSVPPGSQVLGSPAMERRAFGRFSALRARIPELFHRVRRLEQRLDEEPEGEDG